MSAEAIASRAHLADPVGVRRQGLRLALTVAIGFTATVASGAVLPFLGPMFAVQMLTASRRPPRLATALGLVGVILLIGQLLVFTTDLLGDRPFVLMSLLFLVYLACFVGQGRGAIAPAAALVMMIAVIVPLLEILQHDLGESITSILVKSILSGAVLAWLAHVILPDPGPDPSEDADTPAVAPSTTQAGRHALANAFILTAAVTLCLVNDRLSTAIVIPLTVGSLLGQLDLVTGTRAVLGLVLVNLLGGLVASLAFVVLELRPTLPFLFLTVLLVALVFAGRAAATPASSRMYTGALSIFLILFGLGVSPLPAETPDSFTTRIAYVLIAILYTICLAALLWPRQATSTSEALGPTRPSQVSAQ